MHSKDPNRTFFERAQPPVQEVNEADFVTFDEAKTTLGVSGFTFNQLLSENHLRICKLKDGTRGITRQSMILEIVFRRDADWFQRAWRILLRLLP